MRLLLPNCPRSVKASARLRGTQSVRRESAEDCKGYRAGSRAGTSNAEGGKKRIEQLRLAANPAGVKARHARHPEQAHGNDPEKQGTQAKRGRARLIY